MNASPSAVGNLPHAPAPASTQLEILCWHCSMPLAGVNDIPTKACSRCGASTPCEEGIWRCLSPESASTYKRFIAEYELIRKAEGRGSSDPSYYRALPFKDLSGRLTKQWAIRSETFRHLERLTLAPRPAGHRNRHRPLRILDLGAGNCWLSHRLALLGHQPIAVDLLTNATDGLGAAIHYAPISFPRVQASLDHLPFADAALDLAIFNASFHYAEDFAATLAEAVRCLRRGGKVVIADTPWYAQEASGLAMVAEKHAAFRAIYGFASNSVASQEFLTPHRLEHLASTLHLTWQVIKPFYGLQWTLRPLRAKLGGHRIPSQFYIFVAEVNR